MNKTKQLTTAAIVAALYTVLTYLTNLFGLANGVIQVRFSEMLTVLPVLSNAAIVPLHCGTPTGPKARCFTLLQW